MAQYAPKALQAIYPAVKPHESSMRVSGIVGDAKHSGGYHLSRNVLIARGDSSDYSIQAPADKRGDGDACSAIDLGFDPAAMKRVTTRLRAASVAKDPRMAPVREFIGTLDGRNVCGYNRVATGKGTRSRVGWVSSGFSDTSHLWHVHISILRAYNNSSDLMLAVAEVVAGLKPGTLVKLPTSKPAPSIGDEVPSQVNGDVAFATKLALGPNRKTIPLVDKDSPSILSEDHTGDGALRVNAGVNVTFSGLTGDRKVFGCWVLFDDNGKRVGMVKGTQRTGSAGDHTLDVVWPFTLGKNRRLRFEAWTNQPSGVAVTLARSSVHYWKA